MLIKTCNGLYEIIKISNDAKFESLHKRDSDGKFASKGGAGSHKDKKIKGRQTSAGVKKVLARASEREPKITPDIVKAIQNSGGKPIGLEYKLKTEKSATEKAPRERMEKETYKKQSDRYIVNQLWDNVRYSQASNPKTLKRDMYKTLHELESKGYKVFQIKNSFPSENNPYKGINVKILSPVINGRRQKMELQFNTEKNFDIKNGVMHAPYERWRETKSEKLKAKLSQKMFEIAKDFEIPDEVASISMADFRKK